MIISDAEFDRLPASEQSGYMRIRKLDGVSEWRRRTDQPVATSAASKVDEATYERMSPGERYAYARQFDQRQFQTGSTR
jgi:hypothetical protein